ncbi:uncharacterized protein PAC_06798 [Phialocephala subalpina]|uniref:Uncharacterized protein n=1 Tax=Phialocephala subalpina TaxID=576137 RepID=A0A1L7WVW8_9HELO|nr:uncharacterized protein PAC_06798 [Phialocephala subalpina]
MTLLCEYCKKIDFAQVESEGGYKHHDDMAALLLCAEKKSCDFCALINVEGSDQRRKIIGSYFNDPQIARSDEEPEPVKRPTSQVIISINDNEQHLGVKSLCIFEQANLEGGRLKGKGALQNSELEGQIISIPIYTDMESQVAKENLIPGRRLSSTGNSASCLDLSRQWLEGCLEGDKHPACGKANPMVGCSPKNHGGIKPHSHPAP